MIYDNEDISNYLNDNEDDDITEFMKINLS